MTLIARQVMAKLLGGSMDYAKLERLTNGRRLRFEPSDVKAMIAALHFILTHAAKYDVSASSLLNELMQLGLPRDISRAICRCYASNKDALQAHLLATSLSHPRLDDMQWRVDYILSSDVQHEHNAPSVRLRVKTRDGQAAAFEVTPEKFRVFLADLKAARAIMENMDA